MIDQKCFQDIPGVQSWIDIQLVEKGYSKDQKYHILTDDHKHLLLRCSEAKNFSQKEKEYQFIKRVEQTGIAMTSPLSFGICNEGQWVYLLLTWVEGVDLEEMLEKLSLERQYELGRQAGEILKKIHTIPLEECDYPQETKIAKKLVQLQKYEHSSWRVYDDEAVVEYVCHNIQKI